MPPKFGVSTVKHSLGLHKGNGGSTCLNVQVCVESASINRLRGSVMLIFPILTSYSAKFHLNTKKINKERERNDDGAWKLHIQNVLSSQ